MKKIYDNKRKKIPLYIHNSLNSIDKYLLLRNLRTYIIHFCIKFCNKFNNM